MTSSSHRVGSEFKLTMKTFFFRRDVTETYLREKKVAELWAFEGICSAQIVRIFLSTPAQLAAKRRKVEKEKETLAQQVERVSPSAQPEATCAPTP